MTEDIGAVRIAEFLGPILRNRYADFEFEICADPAGDNRGADRRDGDGDRLNDFLGQADGSLSCAAMEMGCDLCPEPEKLDFSSVLPDLLRRSARVM